MSTDISLQSTSYAVGDRRWLLAEPDVKLNVTLDISKFTAGTHFPNGYIPSGTVVGIVTTGGLAGPYDDAASDGRQTAYGITYGDARVTYPNGTNAAKVGISVVVYDAVISKGKLPFQSGTGSLDANGIADLKNIRVEA
ncbi:head decoration protein [Mycobacterium colombiense]